MPVTPTAIVGCSAKVAAGKKRPTSGSETGLPVTSRLNVQGDAGVCRESVPSAVRADSPVRTATDWNRQPAVTLTMRPEQRSEIEVGLARAERQAPDVDAQLLRVARDAAFEVQAVDAPWNRVRLGNADLADGDLRVGHPDVRQREVARGLAGSAGGRGFSNRATFQPAGVRDASMTGLSMAMRLTVRPADSRSPIE